LFLGTALGMLGALGYAVYGLAMGKRRRAGLTLVVTLLWLGVYVLTMVLVSLLTPQHILDQSQERCFDEMGFSVSQVTTTTTLGTGTNQQTAQGRYYVVRMQLRNAAIRTAQKPDHPAFFLDDQQGHRYTSSAAGQRAVGQAPAWEQRLQPGEQQTRDVVFD